MERSVCKVLNTVDKKKMTVVTEWMEETIKLTILREGTLPLTGQTTVAQLRNDPRTNIPLEKSLIQIRNELSGKDNQIQFTLRDGSLTWKKNMAWRLGVIDLEPFNDIVTFADTSLGWLNEYSKLQDANSRQIEEEENRRKNHNELVVKIKSLEDTKKIMEDNLYKQFVRLLNTKKAKIRELEEKIKSLDRSIYNEETDKSSDESPGSTEIVRKKFHASTNEPSTSKNSIICKSSQESESDEIILKLEDTPENLNMEEDSEEDLFSQ